uniref:ankyrin repeat domain-containing protein 26-like isoform X2 n=1 Tax=Doryrhamphus excisus TaxID=161450 RepID=UPI0025ADF5BA|nr:ankyrin repeat domain-containing protein 26-like isoform X2 [Doryrhamphus excisus]
MKKLFGGLKTKRSHEAKEIDKLHRAAWEGDMSKLKEFAKPIDINEVDKQNRTALHIASANGKVEVVKFLLENGARLNLVDSHNKSALMKAVEGQHENIVELLLENNADPNLMDEKGNTALHLASSIPNISFVLMLVKHDADINAKNQEGLSPLTVAAQEDNLDVADFLLKKGADVNILDKSKRSPLMFAAGQGHSSMVQLLLQFHANSTLKDIKGQSAEYYAQTKYHDHCVSLIAKHGTQRSLPGSLSHPSRRTSKSDTCKDGGQIEDVKQKESEMSDLLTFLDKLEKRTGKFELQEDLDWDKTSNASKRTLPGCSVASPASEETPVCSSPSVEERDDVFPKVTRKKPSEVKSINLHVLPAPYSQPRSKKMLSESDKSDVSTLSCSEVKDDAQLGVVPAVSPRYSPMTRLPNRQKWSQVAIEPKSVSMKNTSASSDMIGRASEGHKHDKHHEKFGSASRKEMSSLPDISHYSQRVAPASMSKALMESQPSHHRTPNMRNDEPVGGKSRASRSPQRNTRLLHANDDSTISDLSDDEASNKWKTKPKKKKQTDEISEELDEITSSSSLTVDDCDLRMTTTKDPASKMVLGEIMSQQSKHPFLKAKDPHVRMDSLNKLKTERTELKNQLEEVRDDRCAMEHKEMELQSEVSNLKFRLKQQDEDTTSTIKLCHGNQEKLEEELRHTHSQLNQERCSAAQLQQRLKSQSCKQQTMEEDYRRSRNNEEQLRSELEVIQTHSNIKQRDLLNENEALREQLEDLRQDLKLAQDNHTQNVMDWNNTVQALRCELALAHTRLENELKDHDILVTETQAIRGRLAEAERAKTDIDKAMLQEKEEHQREKDKHANEMANQREATSKQAQKLAKSKALANTLENEVHRVELLINERNQQMNAMQRENDQIAGRVKELEAALQAEKELVSWAGARQEATQDLLAQAQNDGIVLRQKLEEAQNKSVAKENAVADAQKNFTETLSKLRADCDERIQLVQDRNQDLAAKAGELREHIHQLEEEKNEREAYQRHQQAELSDLLKKLSKCEASLEVHMRYRCESEDEKARILKEMDRLKRKLEEKELQILQSEKHVSELRSRLEEREKELSVALQKQKEAMSAATTSNCTVRHLEEAVSRQRLILKSAKRRLREQQASEIDREKASELQAELKRQMSFRSLMERNKKHLEEEVQNLRRKVESSQMEQRQVEQYRREIEEKARQEVQKKLQEVNLFLQSQAATQEAQDQIKATSELSLRARIQELEGEMKRARNNQHETIAQRDAIHKELKRYRQLYREEQWLRKSLTADLKRSNSRLAEANAKLLSEHCKSLVASGPPGAIGPLASTSSQLGASYRGHNSRILSSVAEGHGGNVEDYLAKKKQSKTSCPPRTNHLAEHRKVSWK